MSPGPTIAPEPAGGPPRRLQAPSKRYGEKAIQWVLALCCFLSAVSTTAFVISLVGA